MFWEGLPGQAEKAESGVMRFWFSSIHLLLFASVLLLSAWAISSYAGWREHKRRQAMLREIRDDLKEEGWA